MSTWQKITTWVVDQYNMASGMLRSFSGRPDAWEASIKTFEARDRLDPPPAGAVVFTGSSSFTFWTSLQADMAPLPVINRGFGGAHIGDVAHYAERLVVPYRPRAVMLFAGTNDIAAPRPASARFVFDGYLAFVQRVHAALPEIPIYYVAITPTPLRWKYWSIAREANDLIEARARTDPRLHFIDLTQVFLAANGRPDRRLYRPDRLHPNKKGYAIWTAAIKPVLEADLFPQQAGNKT
jgi:lysophospholipase L1-like esterase